MRNGQNNNKRMRNRNNNNNNNNNNRRGQNPMTRVFESNGPDIKIRGTASHVAEKYVQLARDARSSGDPVAAENYYQHAEHYFRLIAAAQEQFRQNQPQPRPDAESSRKRATTMRASRTSARSRVSCRCSSSLISRATMVQRDHQQSYQPREQHQPREHHASSAASRNFSRSRNPRFRTMAASIACPRSSPGRSRRSAAAGKFEGDERRTLPAASPSPSARAAPGRHGGCSRRTPATISIRGMNRVAAFLRRGWDVYPSSRWNDDGTSTGGSAGIRRVRSRCAGIAR